MDFRDEIMMEVDVDWCGIVIKDVLTCIMDIDKILYKLEKIQKIIECQIVDKK